MELIERNLCSGCGACAAACPQKAISMVEDNHLFAYPVINNDDCINCKCCQKVCPMNKVSELTGTPLAAFGAVNRNDKQIMHETSGGVFGVLAQYVLNSNGIVYGCYMDEVNDVYHIAITSESRLPLICGSKYIQSKAHYLFEEIQNQLTNKRNILFCGTPCQVAGLKSYLGRDYDNLLLVDLICHGVASKKIFIAYLKFLEEREKGAVCDYRFRCKERGWGQDSAYIVKRPGRTSYKRVVPPILSSFYYEYLGGTICRESCTICPFIQQNRDGDITLGDFWGAKEVYPEIDLKKGVSTVLINTPKGTRIWDEVCNMGGLSSYPTTLSNVVSKQDSLQMPKVDVEKRKRIFKLFDTDGYTAIEKQHYKSNFKKILRAKASMFVKYNNGKYSL